MKTLSAPLLLALSLCITPALPAADKKVVLKPAPQPAAQAAAKTDPKAKVITAAKAAPEEPLVGALVERKDGSGGFLNLKVDGGNFVILFLDKDKKAIKGDLFRAIIRYRRHLKNFQFILTLAGDGKSLRSPLPVDRPYIFPALPVVLMKEGQEGVAESYTVPFNQPMPGDGEGIPADEMTPEQVGKVQK
jgi:hypothetical protein